MTSTPKKSRKIVLPIVGLLLVIVASVAAIMLLKYFYPQNFIEQQVVVSNDPRQDRDETVPEGEWIVAPDMPRFISIDSLGISNARVVSLGTKAGTDGQLDDPYNIHDFGWYNESAKPGVPTPQSMAGLYDCHNTGYYTNGVCAHLGRLATGDIIRLERGDGVIFNFAVREVETILLEAIDMAKMQKTVVEGVEGLNIISCGGTWDESRQIYTHRVTVRAVLQN